MACPFAVVPKDRKMTREEYKYLSRCLRVVWRLKGSEIEQASQKAFNDLLIYGHTEFAL